MLTDENQNTSNKEKDKNRPPIVTTETKSDTKDTTAKTNDTKGYIKKALQIWRESTTMEKTQIVLATCSVISIIIFISVSVYQGSQTRDSLNLAKQNYIDENRPYVFPSYPTIRTSKYGELFAILPITNYGRTPAYGFCKIIHFQRWKHIEDPRNFIHPDGPQITLPPSSADTVTCIIDPARKDTSSSGRYYLEGRIWYKDCRDVQHDYTFVYHWIDRFGGFCRESKYESTDTYNK